MGHQELAGSPIRLIEGVGESSIDGVEARAPSCCSTVDSGMQSAGSMAVCSGVAPIAASKAEDFAHLKIKVVVHDAEEGGYWARFPPFRAAPRKATRWRSCSAICAKRSKDACRWTSPRRRRTTQAGFWKLLYEIIVGPRLGSTSRTAAAIIFTAEPEHAALVRPDPREPSTEDRSFRGIWRSSPKYRMRSCADHAESSERLAAPIAHSPIP